MCRISYVVVNYHAAEKILRLLASIPAEADLRGVIVDNSGDARAFEALEAAAHRPDVMCLRADRNCGFAAGTNLGLRAVYEATDLFLILNPDTVLAPGFFAALRDWHSRVPHAVLSPHGLRLDDGRTWSAGGAFHWLRGRADVSPKPRPSGATPFGTCACLAVPKAALDATGLLDDDFFLGGEEWDFSLRLRRAGWPIHYIADAVYRHEISGTHEKYGLRFFYAGMRTKLLFARKHYGRWFWPWLGLVFGPAIPFVLLRNMTRGHGALGELSVSLIRALTRSWRAYPMTEREFTSAGADA